MEPNISFLKKAKHVLSQLIKINNATTDLKDRLENIVFLIAGAFEVAFCGFFSLSSRGDYFMLEAASNRFHPKTSTCRLDVKDVVFHQSIQEKSPLIIADWLDDPQKAHLQKFTEGELRSLLAIPVSDDNVIYGALVLLHEKPRTWSEEEIDLLEIASRELTGAFRNANVLLFSKKRIAELTALFEVEKVLGTTLDLETLLQSVVSIISKVMDADGCGICLINKPQPNKPKPVAKYGDIPDDRCKLAMSRLSGQEVTPFCNMAIGSNSATDVYPHTLSEEGVATAILAPLSVKSKVLGTVCIYRKKGGPEQKIQGFTSEDVRLLSTIGSMIAKSLENALVHADVEALARENENMVRELSTLYEISGHLMTTVSVDEIGKKVINVITTDKGLGFDRAVIFLIDEQEHVLKEVGRKGGEKPAEDIVIPLTETGGILAKAAQKTTCINIEASHADPVVREIWPEGPEYFDYGLVPLVAKDKIVGVMMVDNSCHRRLITEKNLQVLSMLANHAGLALDNARLYTSLDKTNKELVEARELLAETEKIAAMGEMASTLAHEIRNPLVSVGGLARRAIKVINGDTAGKRYLEVIVDEVGRLEKTLNELLDYGQEPEQLYVEKDLVSIVEECLELMRREFEEGSIIVNKDLQQIPPICCDERQIKHTLFNILLNARQAMPSGGTIWVSSSTEKDDDNLYATCTIKDTGGGIPETILHNIFNPFFTTKKGGSGLGLAISYRIVSRHGGKIEVANEPGRGAAFILKLLLDSEHKSHEQRRVREKY